ncbi:DUF885 domain-containing protein [Mycolicibacterium sp. 120270]|uniref:DUF885 domain-containing protein n=1 Tax=Mycolicibacterium sp. 120270 TaxID=3090600 RepID=UPI00299E434B|nr:DUF885 domain-containing protein [Mycolicibacterium sp. 120270]MDX1885587.1 DUF885 domain-containing protein [Mycolicibacterium sp. 120270]
MTGRTSRLIAVLTALLLVATSVQACARSTDEDQGAVSGDDSFRQLANEILEFTYESDPSNATYLGIHKYDNRIRDYSAAGVKADVEKIKDFQARIDAIDLADLSEEAELDLEQVKHTLDGMLLRADVIRPWAKDPDTYSSGITNDAYVIISRSFAPPEDRLKSLISRLEAMPNALAEARKNLDNPPRIYTEIAIEQLDGNRAFFEQDVPAAFTDVKDPALLAEFTSSRDAVVAALTDYGNWLRSDLLNRSNGSFALGEDTYRKVLDADEMITTALPELLTVAEEDLKRNQQAFTDAARQVDPTKSPQEVFADLTKDHPRASELLSVTQNNLDSLAQFVRDKQIIDVPPAPPAKVTETPPFMRATTTAAMDTPGPFEKVATEAYYFMTLPDPSWPKEEQDDFMSQWYRPAISNVSVHEVWPGHYVQFLYAKDYPSDVRKVFGAASNFEGWAHYCEQMMLDEGLHADDPRYRLAEVQDALLRDVRFIVGIKMHTEDMTVEQAQDMFEKEAYQPAPVAESEAKRGTSDATYGYYTMGKLMILKLRDDYRAKLGDAYSLKDFHDKFIRLGPLPLPLIRKAMLGETGDPF